MYSSTQSSNYGHMLASPYHWDNQVQASHYHDSNNSNSSSNNMLNQPNEPHWYSDSVIYHPHTSSTNPQIKRISSTNMDSKLHDSMMYASLHSTTGPRAVIPSKRAAQNRAAQRAFRQRKERYVKDLEKKAKLMDEWKLEMDQLRQQNKELRDANMSLEKQLHQQIQKQQQPCEHQQPKKMILPISSPEMPADVIPAPVVVVMDHATVSPRRKSTGRRIKQELISSHEKLQVNTFMPINLHAPNTQSSFIGSPTTSCSSSSSSSLNGLEDVQQHHHQYHHQQQQQSSFTTQIPWSTPTLNEFEAYDSSLNFISGGEVLDDLCAMLQTRQRPEINHTSYSTMTTGEPHYATSPEPPMATSMARSL